MRDLARLAHLARQLEQQTAHCKRCGICQSVCPLFPFTRMEKDIARGKIAVLEGVMTEVVQNAGTVLTHLQNCLLCGRCAAACPNGVDTAAIFFKARLLLSEYLGMSPVKKFLFRQILARPRQFDRAVRLAERIQPLFIKPAGDSTAARPLRLLPAGILSGRQVPALAPVPLHRLRSTPEPEAQATARPARVLFFTGCLIDRIFPRVGQAALDALEFHGFQPVLLKDEACCGIPALSAGDRPAFERLLTHNLRQLAGQEFDWLVTACATCAFTIKKLWPRLIDSDNPEASLIKETAAKTIDITELIAAQLPAAPPVKNDHPEAVTYHDPCHLKTSLGIYEAPRRLIAASPGYRLIEMEGASDCCGLGGGFGLTHHDLSEKIGGLKRDHILDTGCRMVATSCPACMIQLSGMLAPVTDGKIEVCHPVELYMRGKVNKEADGPS
ncbi:MAG: (Fe-S)-binding protein [Desulfosudaceae bacterium]